MKKPHKEEIKELKETIKDLQERVFNLNPKMYSVEMCVWENGTGSSHKLALCDNIKDATLIVEGLKKTLPSGFGCECGDEKISRRVKIQVRSCFLRDVRDFVKEHRW